MTCTTHNFSHEHPQARCLGLFLKGEQGEGERRSKCMTNVEDTFDFIIVSPVLGSGDAYVLDSDRGPDDSLMSKCASQSDLKDTPSGSRCELRVCVRDACLHASKRYHQFPIELTFRTNQATGACEWVEWDQWGTCVRRRFSEFQWLHNAIKNTIANRKKAKPGDERGVSKIELPTFPSSQVFGCDLELRRRELSTYLKNLLTHTAKLVRNSFALKLFLTQVEFEEVRPRLKAWTLGFVEPPSVQSIAEKYCQDKEFVRGHKVFRHYLPWLIVQTEKSVLTKVDRQRARNSQMLSKSSETYCARLAVLKSVQSGLNVNDAAQHAASGAIRGDLWRMRKQVSSEMNGVRFLLSQTNDLLVSSTAWVGASLSTPYLHFLATLPVPLSTQLSIDLSDFVSYSSTSDAFLRVPGSPSLPRTPVSCSPISTPNMLSQKSASNAFISPSGSPIHPSHSISLSCESVDSAHTSTSDRGPGLMDKSSFEFSIPIPGHLDRNCSFTSSQLFRRHAKKIEELPHDLFSMYLELKAVISRLSDELEDIDKLVEDKKDPGFQPANEEIDFFGESEVSCPILDLNDISIDPRTSIVGHTRALRVTRALLALWESESIARRNRYLLRGEHGQKRRKAGRERAAKQSSHAKEQCEQIQILFFPKLEGFTEDGTSLAAEQVELLVDWERNQACIRLVDCELVKLAARKVMVQEMLSDEDPSSLLVALNDLMEITTNVRGTLDERKQELEKEKQILLNEASDLRQEQLDSRTEQFFRARKENAIELNIRAKERKLALRCKLRLDRENLQKQRLVVQNELQADASRSRQAASLILELQESRRARQLVRLKLEQEHAKVQQSVPRLYFASGSSTRTTERQSDQAALELTLDQITLQKAGAQQALATLGEHLKIVNEIKSSAESARQAAEDDAQSVYLPEELGRDGLPLDPGNDIFLRVLHNVKPFFQFFFSFIESHGRALHFFFLSHYFLLGRFPYTFSNYRSQEIIARRDTLSRDLRQEKVALQEEAKCLQIEEDRLTCQKKERENELKDLDYGLRNCEPERARLQEEEVASRTEQEHRKRKEKELAERVEKEERLFIDAKKLLETLQNQSGDPQVSRDARRTARRQRECSKRDREAASNVRAERADARSDLLGHSNQIGSGYRVAEDDLSGVEEELEGLESLMHSCSGDSKACKDSIRYVTSELKDMAGRKADLEQQVHKFEQAFVEEELRLQSASENTEDMFLVEIVEKHEYVAQELKRSTAVCREELMKVEGLRANLEAERILLEKEYADLGEEMDRLGKEATRLRFEMQGIRRALETRAKRESDLEKELDRLETSLEQRVNQQEKRAQQREHLKIVLDDICDELKSHRAFRTQLRSAYQERLTNGDHQPTQIERDIEQLKIMLVANTRALQSVSAFRVELERQRKDLMWERKRSKSERATLNEVCLPRSPSNLVDLSLFHLVARRHSLETALKKEKLYFLEERVQIDADVVEVRQAKEMLVTEKTDQEKELDLLRNEFSLHALSRETQRASLLGGSVTFLTPNRVRRVQPRRSAPSVVIA